MNEKLNPCDCGRMPFLEESAMTSYDWCLWCDNFKCEESKVIIYSDNKEDLIEWWNEKHPIKTPHEDCDKFDILL